MTRDPVLFRKIVTTFEPGKTYDVVTNVMSGRWKFLYEDASHLWFETAKHDMFRVDPYLVSKAKEVRSGD